MDTQKTLTRADIAKAIIKNFKISRFQASEILEAILEQISKALQNGEEVKFARFGTFYVRDKKERIGRNPKTKEDAVISARKSVTFRASPIFKEVVDKGIECGSWMDLEDSGGKKERKSIRKYSKKR